MSAPEAVARPAGLSLAGVRLPRITFWRAVFVVVVASGLYATWVRFTQGLGASTALSDRFPWGIWVGFDVLCGVGLALTRVARSGFGARATAFLPPALVASAAFAGGRGTRVARLLVGFSGDRRRRILCDGPRLCRRGVRCRRL